MTALPTTFAPTFADFFAKADLRQLFAGPASHFGVHLLLFTAKLATTLEPSVIFQSRLT